MYEITAFTYDLYAEGPAQQPPCLPISKAEMRKKIIQFEDVLSKEPEAMFDDCFPLVHTFVNGAYVRQITMPKGAVLTSKIHNTEHPFFVMKGKCAVITDEKVQIIEAPYWGVTQPGTKRIIEVIEETVWVTVHITELTDVDEIEKQIILPNYSDVIENKEDKL